MRELVLARVPEGTITEIQLEYDDGRSVYEGELYHGAIEYEFEIDAATGQFLSWEEDDHTWRPSSTGPTGTGTDAGAGGSSQEMIGEEQARSLALARAPQGAVVVEIELDRDDGRTLYEGELRNGPIEYEFEIDAYSGDFIKWEEDYND